MCVCVSECVMHQYTLPRPVAYTERGLCPLTTTYVHKPFKEQALRRLIDLTRSPSRVGGTGYHLRFKSKPPLMNSLRRWGSHHASSFSYVAIHHRSSLKCTVYMYICVCFGAVFIGAFLELQLELQST